MAFCWPIKFKALLDPANQRIDVRGLQTKRRAGEDTTDVDLRAVRGRGRRERRGRRIRIEQARGFVDEAVVRSSGEAGGVGNRGGGHRGEHF